MGITLKQTFALLAITLFMLTGCGGGAETPGSSAGGGRSGPPPGSPYFNLAQGDTWTYAKSVVYNIPNSTPVVNDNTIQVTVGTTAAPGTTVSTTVSATGSTPTTTSLVYFLDGNKNLIVTGAYGNVQVLPANPVLNTTWTATGLTYTVTAIAATVIAPAGTFTNCIEITTTGTDISSGSVINTKSYYSSVAGNLVSITGSGTSSAGIPFTINQNLTNYTLY